MIICFYADHPYWSQLNNNGGSRSILLSQMTLRKLGHEVSVVARHDGFSWFKHPKPIRRIPKNADICIAVSISDVKPMLTRMPKKAKAFYWCRLLETLHMPKSKIVRHAKNVHTLVNSECLQAWFAKHRVKTTVAYQGVDVEKWRDLGQRSGKPTIGFLVSKKKRKHFDVVKQIVELCGDKYDYVGYGAKKDQNSKTRGFAKNHFKVFKQNPSHDDLVGLYNLCHTWVVTSTKEGLHNPVLEAALCGAAVVYLNARLGGCADHCIDRQTAWEYESRNAESAAKAIALADKSLNEAHKKLIIDKISDRVIAMERFCDHLKKS